MPTNIRAATSTNGGVFDPATGDGGLDIYTGATSGAQVKAVSIDAAGVVSFPNSPAILSKAYTSSNQTITSAGSLTLAHGLGTIPLLVTHFLVCQTAEAGYSINDILLANTSITNATLEGYGASIVVDSTNINVRYGSQSTVFMANNKTTGSIAVLTNANWRLVVRAWA